MTNQPGGWDVKQHRNRPATTHYCVGHNYIYYPDAWMDAVSGIMHQRGYYDENGEYYDKIVFRRDGKYMNVVCSCPYCGTETTITIDDDTPLKCPYCGNAMEVKSYVDEYTQDPSYTYRSENERRSLNKFLTVFFILFGLSFLLPFLFVFGMFVFMPSSSYDGYYTDYEYDDSSSVSNTDIFGTTIYLDYVGDNTYTISDDGSDTYDKKLTWDCGSDCYYDKDSDCYLWYNTDVAPNLWQYWYEGISSDYGDYGWMEYEPGVWYIETSQGSWYELDDNYISDRLWHFEIDDTDFK
jgi:ribosomal protein S27E